MPRQCWGRTRSLNRCRRIGDWALLCPEHRKQPLVWLFALVFTVGAGLASYYGALQTASQATIPGPPHSAGTPPRMATSTPHTYLSSVVAEQSPTPAPTAEHRPSPAPSAAPPPQTSSPETLPASPLVHGSSIEALMVELRLTATLREGAAPPPAEYFFIPVTGAPAQLLGPPGALNLPFASPLRFLRLDSGEIVCITRFAMPSGADFQGRPLGILDQFEHLVIPIVTALFGDSFETARLAEVEMRLNGETFRHTIIPLERPFPKGLALQVPMGSFGRPQVDEPPNPTLQRTTHGRSPVCGR